MNPFAEGISGRLQLIAQTLIEGFDRHYRIFRDITQQADPLFEKQDWHGILRTVRDRVQLYDERVNETVQLLRERFDVHSLDDVSWQKVKLLYIGHLLDHQQPELAETFFNSVCCKLLHRTYFHNAYIFERPAVATDFIESTPPTYACYYPLRTNLREVIRKILRFSSRVPFEDIERDIRRILQVMRIHFGQMPEPEVNAQIQVLNSPFYRNKSAYIIGKSINGYQETPFAVVIKHGEKGLYVDTLILEAWRISLLFSLSHAYFLVDMPVPSAYVRFLHAIMPSKPKSELYTMLGLGKQGKTMFYRDLRSHLLHSNDKFIVAPGIRGMVMMVFTLPSFPYVFKIIKDQGSIKKDMPRDVVKRKYQMVKQVDRVGRMADTLEFSDVALPLARFSPELLHELKDSCASSLEYDEGKSDILIIKHLYIERRLTPLNLYLDNATDEQIEAVVHEYGCAIYEMSQANIFPGDMLWKNFGVTRYGRVVFYDYDEIEFMSACRFRQIPPAPNPEAEMSSEPWYSVAKNDIFPEEFGTFLLGDPKIRAAFLKHHRPLLTAARWQKTQERIQEGLVEDFFPYPRHMRFCEVFADKED